MKPVPPISALNDWSLRLARWLAHWVGPLTLLLMRLWVADAFWRAGLVKLADPEGTRMLFENLYHVPVLDPTVAAVLGTWIELIAPWLLGAGVMGRLTALFLFAYNLTAVISYPDLWPHGFWIGLVTPGDFADHKVWAMMLLAMIAWGAGPWSVDGVMKRASRVLRRVLTFRPCAASSVHMGQCRVHPSSAGARRLHDPHTQAPP